ncbi:hypothetical protein ACFLZT_07330, partial [Thermodesulfobacteriota bacterium]
LNASLIRYKDGSTNLDFLKAFSGGETAEPEQPKKKTAGFPVLPLDAKVNIHFDDSAILVQDRMNDRQLSATDISFLMETFSILSEPVTVKLTMEEELDLIPLPPINLETVIENFVDSELKLDPFKANVKLNARLPGASIDIQVSGSRKSLYGDVQLDLGSLRDIAQPFLPNDLPELSGRINLHMDASGDTGEGFPFVVDVKGSDLIVSGGPLKDAEAAVDFSALHKGTVDLEKRILDISLGEVGFQRDTRLNWNGKVAGLGTSDLNVSLKVDTLSLGLRELYNLARGILPQSVPVPEVEGIIDLRMELNGDPRKKVVFMSELEGSGLRARKGPFKDMEIGPVKFNITQEGSLDLAEDLLSIWQGQVRISEQSQLSLNYTVKGLIAGEPDIDLKVDDLFFDLDELIKIGESFIPGNIHLYPVEGLLRETDSNKSELQIDEIVLNGSLPSGSAKVELDGLLLSLPYAGLDTDKGSFSVRDIALNIKEAKTVVKNSFPYSAKASISMGMQDLFIRSDDDINLEQLNIYSLEVEAAEIAPSIESLFGIEGKIKLDQTMSLKGLNALSRVHMDEFENSLKVECTLNKGPSAVIEKADIKVSAPLIKAQGLPSGNVETGLELDTSISGLILKELSPLQIDMESLSADLDVSRLLRADINAGFSALGMETFETEGKVSLNLKNLAALAPPDLLPGMALSGTAGAAWECMGRIPDKDEIEFLKDTGLPLHDRLKKTDFLKKFEIFSTLNNVDVEVPLENNTSIKVSGISTDTPLHFIIEDGIRQGDMEGRIIAGSIESGIIPGSSEKPLSLDLAFSGAHNELRTFQLSEELRVEPLNISQSFYLSMAGMDKIMSRGFDSPLQVLLEGIEGVAAVSFRADLDSEIENYIEDICLKGLVEAGTEIRLSKTKGLNIKGRFDSSALDIEMDELIRVRNLETHVDLEKGYVLSGLSEENTTAETTFSPLSDEVLNPNSGTPYSIEVHDPSYVRLMDDLRGKIDPKRTVRFDSVKILKGPLPIDIENHELQFRMLDSLPQIDYFRADLMGGTVIGSVSMSQGEKNFIIEGDWGISGLNANKLLPDLIQGIPDEDAELSGRLSFSIPVASDAAKMLDSLELNADLTHIGSRTLERFLYAMDPFESNETIVSQRKLLSIGTPRWVNLRIRYGNLSLT